MAGNANSGRKRNSFVQEALIIEMKAREADGDKRGIRAVAVKIWDLAETGERWAAEYLRDTIDGKPVQAIEGEMNVEAGDTLKEFMARASASGTATIMPPLDDGDD